MEKSFVGQVRKDFSKFFSVEEDRSNLSHCARCRCQCDYQSEVPFQMAEPGPITQLLVSASGGDRDALAALTTLLYDELRRRAAALLHLYQGGSRHSLRPTELVHEAFVYLMGRETTSWQNRAHFFAHASTLMRWLLVDRARARLRLKRGAGATCIRLDESLGISAERDVDVLALDAALRTLATRDALQAEIVMMRFFGGLSVEEVAVVKGLSKRSVESEWTMIKAWLRRELSAN